MVMGSALTATMVDAAALAILTRPVAVVAATVGAMTAAASCWDTRAAEAVSLLLIFIDLCGGSIT